MNRLATLLVANVDTAAQASLLARLEAAGYHLGDGGDRPLDRARRDHPDLILIGEVGGDPVALATTIRTCPDCADIPLVILVRALTPALVGRAQSARIDEVLTEDIADPELFARLRPLVRLATMHAELHHRQVAAAAFGVVAPDRVELPDSGPPMVLVAGPDPDRLAGRLTGLAEVTESPDLFEAERMLERRNFDAVTITAAGNAETELAFASQIRHNPRLFTLPIVMIVDQPGVAARAYRRGASRVLDRPADDDLLRASVLTLVRRQQLRRAIRDALKESRRAATCDPATGLHSQSFLIRYLASRLSAARTQGRVLTAVLFEAANIADVRHHFGAAAAEDLTRQLGQWIGGLVRSEDPVALIGPDRFAVILPDTPVVEAEVVMHRIAGVLSNTDFAIPDVYQPVRVWIDVGCAAARPEDDGPGLITRAVQALGGKTG